MHNLQLFAIRESSRGQRLLAAIFALVTAVAFDLCVYRNAGGAGWAAFFSIAGVSYFLGSGWKSSLWTKWLIAGMMAGLVARMVWLGTAWQVCVGLILLPMLAMTLQGMVPFLSDAPLFVAQSCFSPFSSFIQHFSQPRQQSSEISLHTVFAYVLPLVIVSVFGVIFVLANPDLATSFGEWISHSARWFERLLDRVNPGELFVVCVIGWLALGQMLPFLQNPLIPDGDDTANGTETAESPFFGPYRNTLVAVTVLFVIYLIFEFQTLWFREFPEGFYYAGYAHKGAAWLTVALALATSLLSLIFRGTILSDPRVDRLKRLAWFWSAANLVLAIAVYNRMWIYIDFNGMTRMRTLGLFGITTVVAGFLLVLWKIRKQRSFVWLIQRQLWALAFAIYLLTMTPVDYLIHNYNAHQIMKGHLAPAVQITEHPVNPSGWLALVPLIDCDNEIIREGIRARLIQLKKHGLAPQFKAFDRSKEERWQDYQIVHAQLRAELARADLSLKANESNSDLDEAWNRFRGYAYQWY